MLGSLRLQLFTRQVVLPAQEAHLSSLMNTLDQTAATRHAVDLAIARWLLNWRESMQPALIRQAVATLLDDEEIQQVCGADPAATEAFERLAVKLASAEMEGSLPQLRSAAERLRRVRLFVH